MANLKEIRNRITSVSSTKQITSAMKMVSAAKLRKSQTAIQNFVHIPKTYRDNGQGGWQWLFGCTLCQNRKTRKECFAYSFDIKQRIVFYIQFFYCQTNCEQNFFLQRAECEYIFAKLWKKRRCCILKDRRNKLFGFQ